MMMSLWWSDAVGWSTGRALALWGSLQN